MYEVPLSFVVVGGILVVWILAFFGVLRTKDSACFGYPLTISVLVAIGYGLLSGDDGSIKQQMVVRFKEANNIQAVQAEPKKRVDDTLIESATNNLVQTKDTTTAEDIVEKYNR